MRLENYKGVNDPAFKVEDNTFIFAWITTHWPLVSNLAPMDWSNHTYVKLKSDDKFYILVKSILSVKLLLKISS
jgi:isoleucyl-tRNA synthetase